MEIPKALTTLAVFDALRNQQYNLEETIGRLADLKSASDI